MGRYFLRSELSCTSDLTCRSAWKYRVAGIHSSSVRWHYMFCHFGNTRVAQLWAYPGSLTSAIRLLKTRYLTTWTSVYTVVKPRTCRRAIIVTIRDRIVTGLKLLRNHGVQLRGSRFRIIRLFPTAPYSLSSPVFRPFP